MNFRGAAFAVHPCRPTKSRCNAQCGHSGAASISESTTGPKVLRTSAVLHPFTDCAHPISSEIGNGRFSRRRNGSPGPMQSSDARGRPTALQVIADLAMCRALAKLLACRLPATRPLPFDGIHLALFDTTQRGRLEKRFAPRFIFRIAGATPWKWQHAVLARSKGPVIPP